MEPVKLTEDQFKTLAKAMKAVYPQPTFLPDELAGKVWYGLLSDIPYDVLQNGIQKHIMTSPYPPTIADLRLACADFMAKTVEQDMTELEAWAKVRKAICRSTYYAEEEFEKLPPACQKAVGSPANLREWARMDPDSIETVEQSHFIRNFRAMVKRENELARLSPSIRSRIEALSSETIQKIEHHTETPEIEDKQEGIPMPERFKEQLEAMKHAKGK